MNSVLNGMIAVGKKTQMQVSAAGAIKERSRQVEIRGTLCRRDYQILNSSPLHRLVEIQTGNTAYVISRESGNLKFY